MENYISNVIKQFKHIQIRQEAIVAEWERRNTNSQCIIDARFYDKQETRTIIKTE